MDVPQSQLRAIVIPADPVPVINPRVEAYLLDETNYRATSGQNTVNARTGIPVPGNDIRITQDLNKRVTQQTGESPKGFNTQPGTDPNAPGNSDPGLPYDNTEVPKTGPLD